MTERNNTSSSSSSVSSFNSSISLSPAKGRLNSSLNRSVSGPAPGSISRPAVQSRPRRSTVTAEPASAGRRSLSLQNRKLPEVEGVKPARSTLLKRADSTPVQSTPAKRGLEKTGSMPARPQSALRSRSKPEALAVLTPGGGFRGVRNGDAPDVSKMLKPKALTSVSSVDSLSGPLTPSAGGCKSLQLKPRRPSALPTPVKRRMSAIPVATPTTKSRPSRLPSNPDPACIPAPIMRERSCSPAPMEVQEAEPVEVPVIQPFCLEEEEEELPAAPPTSSPQPDQSERPVPAAPSESQLEAGAPSESPSEAGAPSESPSEAGAPSHTQLGSAVPATPIQSQSEPSRNLIEQETKEERHHKTQEVLLLDLPTPMLHPQEKLLIDLTNTPDLIRTSNKSCTNTQLIDLTSPLIKWSPEDKRENNAPLINLSF
ncbi:hypothetical protein PBY51_011406 [Eleginops maclovinus]|uniref:G2 and S phase-expressed protein 1 N-terminal domain-containing protein n=2 Tax=Eleginops maclovinus TaxID=56733 RepID=A0AAN7XN40_ELEMC|nr:hypothetical protein PBY51_011406 [Eleginops maclovinus]